MRSFRAKFGLGDVVRLFGDRLFVAAVTSVEFRLGRSPRYCVEWREGRQFCERWISAEEIDAFSQIEEAEGSCG